MATSDKVFASVTQIAVDGATAANISAGIISSVHCKSALVTIQSDAADESSV